MLTMKNTLCIRKLAKELLIDKICNNKFSIFNLSYKNFASKYYNRTNILFYSENNEIAKIRRFYF